MAAVNESLWEVAEVTLQHFLIIGYFNIAAMISAGA